MTENFISNFHQPLKVLVVEDNKIDRIILESMLKEPPNVTSAIKITDRLKSAIKEAGASDYDIVILDLNVPDSSGEETLIRFNKEYPNLPVVVHTGAYEEDLGLAALGVGAQDFLVKGKFTPYTLNKALHYAIERKRLQLQLLEANTKVQNTQLQLVQAEKMKVVGGLASGVAHEVKNPLATILYGVTYLTQTLNGDDEKIQLVLDNIKEAVDRANNIITDLLDFSSIHKMQRSPEDLNQIVEKSLSLVHHEFDKKHIQAVKELNPKIPKLNIDRNRIEQVIINLVLNAVLAMPDGGKITLRSDVRDLSKRNKDVPQFLIDKLKTKGRIVLLQIDDEGCGIPDDQKDKAFDPFFTTRRSNGGVGLGLAISKSIMENHDAALFIENRKEGGLRATMVFKAYKA